MKKPLQPAGQLLGAPSNQSDDLVGTQKTVPVDKPDNSVVALGQPNWRNFGNALEARKAGHPARMSGS